jgi:hypothetical protein
MLNFSYIIPNQNTLNSMSNLKITSFHRYHTFIHQLKQLSYALDVIFISSFRFVAIVLQVLLLHIAFCTTLLHALWSSTTFFGFLITLPHPYSHYHEKETLLLHMGQTMNIHSCYSMLSDLAVLRNICVFVQKRVLL